MTASKGEQSLAGVVRLKIDLLQATLHDEIDYICLAIRGKAYYADLLGAGLTADRRTGVIASE